MAERTLPAVAVLAKAPVPGTVKTRLIPALGAENAAWLHEKLVLRTLTTIRDAGFCRVTLWCAPDRAHPFFADCAKTFAIALADQPSGDLGTRMSRVFDEAHGPLLLVGSDCPSITTEHLHACAAALGEGCDAAFLPAEDGGYGLVGLRKPAPALFGGMIWSTPDVMQQTRERLRSLGLAYREPAVIWDIDRPEDLARLGDGFPSLIWRSGLPDD